LNLEVSQGGATVPPFIESIVHPTDFSGASERAFAHALAVALVRRGSLKLLHVSREPHRSWREFPAVRATLERWRLLKPGSSQMQVFEELGVRVSKVAISSPFPALAVASYLDGHPTDLLVVATEGREGVARWLRGSKAEAIARWTKTMTLFVPADTERSLVSIADGDLELNNVLIPIDHSPDPSAAIEFARRAAQIIGDGNVTITLLFVGADADMPRVQTEDGVRCRFERRCRQGDPVEVILQTAELTKAELIVMPTAGRAGVFDALRGSTTERVLRGANCPLLAVPAPAERMAVGRQHP
jgi:nucleotide-binding universal stress UspA family protein